MHFAVHTPLFAALAALLTAAVVFRKDAAFKINRRFSLLCLALAAWNFSYFGEAALAATEAQRLGWSKASHAAGFFALSIALHFMVRFTRDTRFFYKAALGASYALSALSSAVLAFTPLLIADVRAFDFGFHAVWGPFYPVYLAHLALNYLLMIVLLTSSLKAAASHTERNRIRYILYGSVIVILTSITNFLPAAGVNLPTLGFLGTLLFMTLVWFGIYRHRLMNIRLALAKYLLLTLFWLIMGACYSALVFGMSRLFHSNGLLLVHLSTVGLFVILFLLSARSVLPFIERLIYPLRSDLKRMLESFDRASLRALDGADAARALFTVARDLLKAPSAALYLKSARSGRFELLDFSGAETGHYPPSIGADAALASATDALVREELRRDAELEQYARFTPETLARLISGMEALHSEAVLPLVAEGETLGFLCFARKRFSGVFDMEDISGLKLLAGRAAMAVMSINRIRELKERENLALVGSMTAGIAHEIKNPLGAIKGAADHLVPSLSGEKERALALVIADEAGRLDRIVRDFLYFARPLPSSAEKVELSALAVRCRELFLAEAATDRFTLTVSSSGGNALVRIDPDLFKQVFFNLAKNSLEADPAGRLDVVLTDAGGRIRAEFGDTCGGMAPDALEKAFTPFNTTKAQGTGLGLSIVKKLVSLMNGEIYISSVKGKGTNVTIDLPPA